MEHELFKVLHFDIRNFGLVVVYLVWNLELLAWEKCLGNVWACLFWMCYEHTLAADLEIALVG